MALPILSFTIEAEEVTGGEFRRLTVPGDQLQVVLEHLAESTSWRFRVAATNAAGQGEWTDWTEPVSPLPPEVPPQGAPTITSISPSFGPAEGGTLVTLRGFDFTSDSTVSVGGSEPIEPASISEDGTELTFVMPPREEVAHGD